MGVKGGWNLLNPTSPVSFVDWSSQNISTGTVHELGPHIGIDASVGKQLFKALEASEVDEYAAVASAWHQDLCTTLEKQGAGHLHSRHHSLASRIPLDFPKASVLIQYIHLVTSESNGTHNLPTAPSLRQPDIPYLAKLCEELFIWGHSMGIIHNFHDHLFPGLATWELLQDLCKWQGLLQASDTDLSQHPVVSKVCAICANQHERSHSEIFVSLIVPSEVLTQITSAIDGTYNTNTTLDQFDQFVKKPEIHVWLSRILAIHARPNILDETQHQTPKAGKKRKTVEPHIKKMRLIEAEPSLTQPVVSYRHNMTNDITNAPGIRKVLETQSSDLEIMDDIEGEQETCSVSNGYGGSAQMDLSTSDDVEEVLANISTASKGVKKGTAAAYEGVMAMFNNFLIQENIIQPGMNIFHPQKLNSNIDYYIVGFIMQKCDDVDMHGTSKGLKDVQRSYSHAQKLRASTTYGFR
ncbi:uncharacterized protein ARMOST_19392 [Armillaria ostoyae]|uniref:Uncharacterized protein n=1 Tax=Armillaria ostoyae TaxID=47428 RepID=A0A284S4E6_ARMOS|nr:uncharacterized protein ARMOST_19392 [Armillaria ostoyae]